MKVFNQKHLVPATYEDANFDTLNIILMKLLNQKTPCASHRYEDATLNTLKIILMTVFY